MNVKYKSIVILFLMAWLIGTIGSKKIMAQPENTVGYFKEVVIHPLIQTETGPKLKIENEFISLSPDVEIKICGNGPFDISYFDKIVGEKCIVFISTENETPLVKSISLLCE